jgi:uncharacterized membrane protein YjgN (DUF898 family)
MELFIGFLVAIALLVPVYVLFFLGTLELGLVSQLSSSVAFLFLAVFGQYAYYRARRYRLTRTIFRGVRFHQSGSPWSYALRSLLWWIAIGLTLGLAYPWAQASLERYKLAHTHYGDVTGEFAGSGTKLFLRGIALWLIMVALLAALGGASKYFADTGMFAQASQGADKQKAAAMIGAVLGGLGLSFVVVGSVVYAIFQGIIMRWWLAGLRFGAVTVTTTLKKRQIFGAYLRCFLWSLLLVIALSIVFGIAFAASGISAKADNTMAQILIIAGTAVIYLTMAVGIWVIYQLTIKLRVWRVAVDSLQLAGAEAIAGVRADDSLPASAVGEGLADALGAGGI